MTRAAVARAAASLSLATACAIGPAAPAVAQTACEAVAVSASLDQSVVVRGDGGAWLLRDAPAPLTVPGAVLDVRSADRHHVLLLEDGRVFTHGRGTEGELGPAVPASSLTGSPVEVTGLPPVARLAPGRDHVVVVDVDGTAWGWGANDLGQLGGEAEGDSAPRQVEGLPPLADVACGDGHCLAIDAIGDLWAWGDGTGGQVGHGLREVARTPVRLAAPTGVVAIAAGEAHSLAIDSDGRTWGWGRNESGVIADAALVGGIADVPVPLTEPVGAVDVAAGGLLSLALLADGTLLGWGRNDFALVDRALPIELATPSPVPGVANVVAVDTSGDHAIALRSDGTVATWGRGGALGVELQDDIAVPTPLPRPVDVVQLSSHGSHVLALGTDGSVHAWGLNRFGVVIGDGSPVAWRRSAVAVPLPAAAVEIAAGEGHSLARLDDGRVVAWGSGSSGELGTGAPESAPTWIESPDAAGAVGITGGDSHSLMLMADGTVLGSGMNTAGQLALPATTFNVLEPTALPLPEPMAAIAAGPWYSLAIDTTGTAWGWGRGALGGSTQVEPTRIPGLPEVTAIDGAARLGVALGADGSAWAWGERLGDVTGPTPLDLGEPAVAVSAGNAVGVVTASGRVVLVGGRFGAELDPSRTGPLPAVPGIDDAIDIVVSAWTVHVLHEDGTLSGWGVNARGQVGVGTGGFIEPALDPGFAGPVPELGATLRVARAESLGPAAVALSWAAHHAADSHAVHRATLPDFSDDELLLTVPTPAAEDTALPGAALVLYRVAGIDCDGVEGP